ncbi:MAG: hypothetical protein JNJ45_04135 [Chthonomonas sp.]|nr:hypothetical protein [Chthonomonas sp.]
MKWLVNRVWWGMLWFMRRPLMKRLQRASYSWGSPDRQRKMKAAFIRQNQFARRWGRPMLTGLFTFLAVWFLILIAFVFATDLRESGVLESAIK